ncbi:nitroreductase family protein [Halorubrum sp. JWXQ-INN 858]|uniref:nitroreductase family protein n=1 Tax=Halorubrum sp. JWXQ-INN 858 TaxID=2690782 RepID=UPI00135B1305|nr:nitroreductase family protein [Halorubrum sp. JWXQ-INN 858]MWV63946.1 nitroreductase family protein [Halorubrum sp. JWXQ-INN 858]
MEFTDVVDARRSVHDYADEDLDRETIEAIVEAATTMPSSYNLQPWEFLVLTEDADRERLREVAYGQAHVTDAPVAVVVLGNLDPAAHVDRVLDDQVEKGYRDEAGAAAARETIVGMREYPTAERRVWAAKSTSLAAMGLMLAARDRGVATCPIGGFDPEALHEAFDVPDGYEPVMLVTMGYPAADAADEERPRKLRRPVSEVVHYGSFDPDGGADGADGALAGTEATTDD